MVKLLSRWSGITAVVLIGLAILVVCEMVVMRYFLQASAIWQTDFVIFALVGATLIGSPYVLMIKGHVNIDLVPLYLGRRGKFILALVANFGGLAFCLILAWVGSELFYEALSKGWRTDTIWSLPLWIPYTALPLGLGLLCLQYVADILALLSGREMPFAAYRDPDESGP